VAKIRKIIKYFASLAKIRILSIDFVILQSKRKKMGINDNMHEPLVDFDGPKEDKSKNIIKVIGVGGGGCNAVRNMYNDGIVNVTFAVCNTDSQSLSKSPIPVKIQLGETGLGAGANPDIGKKAAIVSKNEIERLISDGTKMVFVTAGMGGGTGTGAAPVIAGIAKAKGILTIGIVTIPFYFEKKNKIIKALRGVEEMRKNVDALLIINNERICDIYSDTQVTIKESFKRADQILSDATKSISELITVEGDINLDFCDVETTLRGGGGAIMAMGRANGEHRVEKAVIDALDSPLLYDNDIDRAKRILFNIYTSEKHPLFVSEMTEIDAFMDALDPNIDVIWGVSDDNTLDEDAKVTILATGFEDDISMDELSDEQHRNDNYFDNLINNLYKPYKKRIWNFEKNEPQILEPQNTDEEGATVTKKIDIDGIPLIVTTGSEEDETETDIDSTDNHVEDNAETTQEEEVTPEEETTPEETTPVVDTPEEQNPTSTSPSVDNSKKHKPLSFVDRAKKLMEKLTELTQDPEK
jgi:cell division protein FtsZ